MYDDLTDEELSDPFAEEETPARYVNPFFSTLPDTANNAEYLAFMRNEAAAAHARYFAQTPENRERIQSWNAFAAKINARA